MTATDLTARLDADLADCSPSDYGARLEAWRRYHRAAELLTLTDHEKASPALPAMVAMLLRNAETKARVATDRHFAPRCPCCRARL